MYDFITSPVDPDKVNFTETELLSLREECESDGMPQGQITVSLSFCPAQAPY